MVNSAIGDHGNERHQTSPTLSLSPSLSLPLSLALSLSHCMIYCVWGRTGTVVCARPGQTKRSKSLLRPAKRPNRKLSLWHLATYFFHPWLTFSVGNSHSACLFVFCHSTILPRGWWTKLLLCMTFMK